MKVQIQDGPALRQIDPRVLLHFAQSEGWRHVESFGRCSDVFRGHRLPEIVIPRTNKLDDYANVVSRLIQAFCEKTGEDELTIYERLRAADYDRVRFVAPQIRGRGVFGFDDAINAIALVNTILQASASSLYRMGRTYSERRLRQTTSLIRRFRLEQTDTCGFCLTLSYRPSVAKTNAKSERQVTVRLLRALQAIRMSGEKFTLYGERVFDRLLRHGVSSNLCDALASMINQMGPIAVHVSWAAFYPTYEPNTHLGLSGMDVGLLRAISRRYRSPGARIRDLLRV